MQTLWTNEQQPHLQLHGFHRHCNLTYTFLQENMIYSTLNSGPILKDIPQQSKMDLLTHSLLPANSYQPLVQDYNKREPHITSVKKPASFPTTLPIALQRPRQSKSQHNYVQGHGLKKTILIQGHFQQKIA